MGWKCLSRCMYQDIMLWIEERASLLSPLACRPFAAQAVRGSIHNLARLSSLRHS